MSDMIKQGFVLLLQRDSDMIKQGFVLLQRDSDMIKQGFVLLQRKIELIKQGLVLLQRIDSSCFEGMMTRSTVKQGLVLLLQRNNVGHTFSRPNLCKGVHNAKSGAPVWQINRIPSKIPLLKSTTDNKRWGDIRHTPFDGSILD
jgi:hypothetical protein